jgi:hypothetical protein
MGQILDERLHEVEEASRVGPLNEDGGPVIEVFDELSPHRVGVDIGTASRQLVVIDFSL